MNSTLRARQKVNIGGIALIVSSIFSKFLGAIYRIPLTNILGAEGIGMYQLIFPVYALMLSLSSGGIPTAIARLVAERQTFNDFEGEREIVKAGGILLSSLGFLFALILLLCALPLSRVQSNEELAIVYYSIAPAILLVSISSVLKGYFQGVIELVPTAISQLAEQVVKMAMGLVLASQLLRYGIVYGVVGAVVGVVSGELMSLIIMIYLYMKRRHTKTHVHIHGIGYYARQIMNVSLPITISGIIYPVMGVVDSLLIVNILRNVGVTTDRATALYGLLTGPVGTLINMPIVITLAIAVLIIPIISKGRVSHDATFVKAKARTSIKISYIIGVPCFVGIFFLADIIMKVLYPTLSDVDIKIASGLLRVSSVLVILLSEVHIYTSILEAVDKSRVSMTALIAGAVIKVILSIILIMRLKIVGAAVASIISYLTVVVIDSIYLRRYFGSSDMGIAITKVLISSLVMGVPVYLCARFLSNIYVSLLLSILIAVAMYGVFMLSWKVLDDDELLSLPMGSFLLYLSRKLSIRR